MGSARPRSELGSSGLVDMLSGIERESSGGTFKRIRLLQIQPYGAAAGRLAVTAVMDALAKVAMMMVEMAAAMMRSKSHRLPDTTIQEKAAGEGRGGGWVGTAVTMTAKAVTPVMVVAVAGRSRTGGSGVKRHGRRRLGRPTAAPGPETIWRESERGGADPTRSSFTG